MKKEKNHEDTHKGNIIIPLEKVTRIEPEESLPKFNKDSAFAVTTKNPHKKYKFQCTQKEERDLWISMFEYVQAVN